ncbi:hypothetical protein EDD86DRAFT_212448 [Gorgonomyces haynaldii]|nr:hypothetical protein EDD86DRAFT_212448 [Gorgonomyces haynaldii]
MTIAILSMKTNPSTENATATKSLAVLLAVATVLYSIIWFPGFSWGTYAEMTDHKVDQMDLYFLLFGLMPMLFLVLIWIQGGVPTVSSSAWIPRWVPKHRLLNSWSRGDIFGMAAVVLANLIWWFVPAISRIVAPPAHGMGGEAPHEMTVRLVFDKIFGWAGMAGVWDAGYCILFAVRENAFAKTVLGKDGGQYHRGLKYHIVFGYWSFGLITLHSLYYILAYLADNTLAEKILPWVNAYGFYNFYGLIAWICMILMIATSVFKVRRLNYRIFYWTHQLYVPFLLFSALHYYVIWYAVVGPLIYLIFDRLAPRLRFKRQTLASIKRVSHDTVRMDISNPSGYAYGPGDWVNVLVPQISSLNWHPFSIASSYTVSSNLTLFCKANGPWTSALLDLGQKEIEIPVKVDGPFGSNHRMHHKYQSLVVVAGGAGVAALCPYIVEWAKTGKPLTIYWSCKRYEDFLPYQELLNTVHQHKWINLNLHVTRDQMRDCKQVDVPDQLLSSKQDQEPTRNASQFVLALVVFVFGALGYVFGRLFVFSFNMDYCMSTDSYIAGGMDQFVCWYWYYFGPLTLPVVMSLLAGFGWIFVASSRSQRVAGVVTLEQQWTLDMIQSRFTVKVGRPDLIFFETDQRVAVLAAGPNSMVKHCETMAVSNGHSFFQESWKV